mmetsp:Transcript_37332/g.105328  ORF Transcript_37332/g.105328 Transcript_37332/m.105328 type:complete len:255 (-) Transcript_37332:1884-2648(-)
MPAFPCSRRPLPPSARSSAEGQQLPEWRISCGPESSLAASLCVPPPPPLSCTASGSLWSLQPQRPRLRKSRWSCRLRTSLPSALRRSLPLWRLWLHSSRSSSGSRLALRCFPRSASRHCLPALALPPCPLLSRPWNTAEPRRLSLRLTSALVCPGASPQPSLSRWRSPPPPPPPLLRQQPPLAAPLGSPPSVLPASARPPADAPAPRGVPPRPPHPGPCPLPPSCLAHLLAATSPAAALTLCLRSREYRHRPTP